MQQHTHTRLVTGWMVSALALGTLAAGACFGLGGDANECSTQTCSGCCSADGRCLSETESEADNTCGAFGGVCQDCGSRGLGCRSGACVPKTPGGELDGGLSCGGEACNTCCTGTAAQGQCVRVTSRNNCGSRGRECVPCRGGEDCVDGRCQAVVFDGGESGVIGRGCAEDSECFSAGNATFCKQHTIARNATYSGGYCTRDCIQDGTCPSGALCTQIPRGFGDESVICLSECVGNDGCRDGYACYPVGQNKSVCWLDPNPAIDGGLPADKVGEACTVDSECTSPPDDGVCLKSVNFDGGISPWTGGYCTVQCTEDATCSADDTALCFPISETAGACLKVCSSPRLGQGDCRANYVCEGFLLNDGGVSSFGVCWPSCHNAPGLCAQGSQCYPDGYCR